MHNRKNNMSFSIQKLNRDKRNRCKYFFGNLPIDMAKNSKGSSSHNLTHRNRNLYARSTDVTHIIRILINSHSTAKIIARQSRGTKQRPMSLKQKKINCIERSYKYTCRSSVTIYIHTLYLYVFELNLQRLYYVSDGRQST